ncbi:hypothetical protein [Loktanella sp. SALINAS62]|uniref:hypothetical protein n=1 Tax=Loktanella sp. SALINAS62 TaxID=2706124 RepID=UPI001B8B4C50|nr:hypothetical protein [Loktanella sp. SALINAS62]MBS1301789.1 hypothetical protein [Loktanella sp. SALINAS62]
MQDLNQIGTTVITRIGALEQALKDAASFEDFHASPASERLRDAIMDQASSAQIVSFDIFDTVLWRDDKSELERFAYIARAFTGRMPGHDARAWLAARIFSASHAYQMSEIVDGTTEGRLSDIALNMMHAMRVAGDRQEAARLWCQTELEVETRQLRVAPFIDQLISQLVADGKQVIFLSDMYLQADQIRQLLNNLAFDLGRVTRLISTADERVNKRSGTIFPRIFREMDLQPGAFLHMGDSLTSDYIMPIRSGWAARYLPVPRATLIKRRESHFQCCATMFGRRQTSLPMAAPAL